MQMQETDVANMIRNFVVETFGDDLKFENDTDLFELGLIDSLRVQELLTFMEEEFKITVPDHFFFDERFAHIEGQASIVLELRDES